MSRRKLPVTIDREGDRTELRSPAVGHFRPRITTDAVVVRGTCVGELEILGEIVDLVVAEEIFQEVTAVGVAEKQGPVDYGATLLTLSPLSGDEERGGGGGAGETKQLQDGIVVRSPTVGVFYRRSNPTSEAYVEVGASVSRGQTLGLVEVMKCFNQVRYEGVEVPDSAEVIEICATDGEEVKNDQPLFVLR